MTILIECREWLKRTYGRFSLYIRAGIRFITGVAVFMLITYKLGYMARLNNPVVPLILAMLCTFLPMSLTAVAAIALLLAHLYALSMEIALVMLVIFLILYLIYYRFAPKYSIVLLLTPIAFCFHVPYVIPILLGLAATPVAALPTALGCIVYYLLHYIAQYGQNAASATTTPTVQKYVFVFGSALKDPGLYLCLGSFILALFVVYFIRSRSIDNAWTIAIVVGTILQLVCFLVGNFAMDISFGTVEVIVGNVLSLAVGMIVQFFCFHVDYLRTEYVQFEDDEYYYYVKAVPKVSITKREKTVKRINVQEHARPGASRQREKNRVREME